MICVVWEDRVTGHLEASEAWKLRYKRSLSPILRSDALAIGENMWHIYAHGYQGCRVAIREAVMASEAILRAVRGNMHTNTRVIMVADLKSEVKFDY